MRTQCALVCILAPHHGNGATLESRELIKIIKAEGFHLVRVNGSHHVFDKPGAPFPISLPHPVKDVSIGVEKDVRRKLAAAR